MTTAAVTPVIATQRSDHAPAWAAGGAAMVYVTDRAGAQEIWWHQPGQTDRPLVTARDFPPETTQWFMGPSLSPDGTRVIYTRIDRGGDVRLWMSATAGGAPVPLVKNGAGSHYPGSWSPDGRWYVFLQTQDGRFSVQKVRTTGQGVAEVLKGDIRRVGNWVPTWSPTGDWILYTDGGAKLIAPTGASTRDLPETRGLAYAFSADGQTIYGIRHTPDARVELFSIPISGGTETIHGSTGPEYLPASLLRPTDRLTLTPDGKHLAYSTRNNTYNLWLMDGLEGATAK